MPLTTSARHPPHKSQVQKLLEKLVQSNEEIIVELARFKSIYDQLQKGYAVVYQTSEEQDAKLREQQQKIENLAQKVQKTAKIVSEEGDGRLFRGRRRDLSAKSSRF